MSDFHKITKNNLHDYFEKRSILRLIYCIIILAIGLSGVISRLTTGSGFFQFISPAPRIFTKQKQNSKTYYFEQYADDKHIGTVKFNQKLFKSLSGPHRYKVVYFNVLRRGRNLFGKEKYNSFINYALCKQQDGKKVTEVRILTEGIVKRVYLCK